MAIDRLPAEVFPPGEFLKDELEARGWTQSEFAEILGRPVNLISEIINGRRGITPTTAKELGAALGTSALFWLNLDSAYQLHRTEPAPKRIRIEAKLRERYPVRDMITRNWIEASETPEVLESRVLQYFGVSRIDEQPRLAHAAKKGTGGEPRNYGDLTPLQLAWLFRVKQIADRMVVPNYSEAKLRTALPELQSLMSAPEEARHAPRLLEQCGIRFVVVEPLPSSRIDGVCFWLNGQSSQPVIGLSLRFDRIDNFWFVLRHEIEHVLQRSASFDDEVVIAMPSDEKLPEDELQANEAAAEFCLSQEELNDFIARVKPLFSERRVVGFANRLGLHPGIVVGQLQRRLQRYDLLRAYMARIRDFVTATAVTDGYGQVYPIG